MKSFSRMMRVVGVVAAVSAWVAAPAHAQPVPFGSPVVADQETNVVGAVPGFGALIKLNPLNSGGQGIQTIVAPDGAALAPGGTNYFRNPTGLVQREDQVYDVADEGLNTLTTSNPPVDGAVIEVNLVTGKQTRLDTGGQFVNPTALVIDPVTDDIYVLDRSAGTGGRGAIFRMHENGSGGIDVTMVHDGGCNANAAGGCDADSATNWSMLRPRSMDIDPQGRLVVADRDASAPGTFTNGTIFRVDPNAAPISAGNLWSTPREELAWDANGSATSNPATQTNPGGNQNLLYDPQGVIVRPDGIYVADSKSNVLSNNAGVIRVDPVTHSQTLISGGYPGVSPPTYNFFAGAMFGIAPVNPSFGTGAPGACTVATDPQCDDVYVLDADYIDRDFKSSGMVGVVNPTITDPSINQTVFGSIDAGFSVPFSFNNTDNNVVKAFVEPRALVTSRNLPDPPLISVNTDAADIGIGASDVFEPKDATPGQISCGDEGSATCRIAFNVRLNNPWKRTVKVNYSVANVTASDASDAGNLALGFTPDYVNPAPSEITLTFPPNVTKQTVYVDVSADLFDEPDEKLKLTLSTPVNSTLDPIPTRSSALGTILDNDNPPKLTATSPPDFLEANGNVVCKVQLDAISGKDVAVNWGTADGTAVSPLDYTGRAAQVVTIPKGKPASGVLPAADLQISVLDDAIDEDTENFVFNIASASNTTPPATPAKCTANILDNDDPPKVSIANVKSNEGNSGQRLVTLAAVLSGPSGKTITVNWATQDDAATLANKDYVQANGTLTFKPGETSQNIVVKFVGDTVKEQDEPFKVILSNPSATVTIGVGTAVVTIVNDDSDATSTPGAGVQDTPGKPGGKPGAKVCKSRRTFSIRVKKTKLRQAKVLSAKIYVNGKLTVTRKGKRLTAPVVLKGLKKGRYKVVIKSKLSDGRTVTDIRRYFTCRKKIVK